MDLADNDSINVARSRELLAQHGITHILSLTETWTRSVQHPGIQMLHIDIEDNPYEDLLVCLDGLCAWIDNALKSGGRVLVHCIQGISRSGAVVIAYMMRACSMGYYDALHVAQRCRSLFHPNSGFSDQLRLREELNCTIFEPGNDAPRVKQEYSDWKADRGLVLSVDAQAKQEDRRKIVLGLVMHEWHRLGLEVQFKVEDIHKPE